MSRRGASGSVHSSWPPEQSGDSPIIATAAQTRRATHGLMSVTPRLVQRAKAALAGLARIDDAVADAVGGKRGRIEARRRGAADERHACPGQLGISGERVSDLRADQKPADV